VKKFPISLENVFWKSQSENKFSMHTQLPTGLDPLVSTGTYFVYKKALPCHIWTSIRACTGIGF